MSPPDEAPEQRWRRTVDRRNRPAKLKVDRLLRDFGYAELDPDVGDAIEARLAGVSLAVAPSLRNAVAGEVVTIYANDSAAPEEGGDADVTDAAEPAPAEEPAVSDVAQMVTYLKQQVLDARAEAERLRTELDRRIAARLDSERENERIIAEQAAALEAQSLQLAELGAALNTTREALAETRDEIRRAVGELQALPEPVATVFEAPPLPDDEPVFAAEDGDAADAGSDVDAPAIAAVEGASDEDAPAADPAEPSLELDEPEPEPEPEPAAPEPAVAAPPDPEFDLEEAAPRAEAVPERQVPEPEFDLDEPPLRAPAPARQEPKLDLDLDDEFDVAVPAADAEAPGPGDARDPAADDERFDDLDVPLPPASEWLPAGLRPHDDDRAAAEPPPAAAAGPDAGGEGPDDFDDFLYDADELYDPEEAGRSVGNDTPLESEIEAQWPDEPSAALPPPPPAPPSPFADEPAAPPPVMAERPTIGRVLRGRGGRSRGRWEGTCSICGRLPQVTRRKDLEAAGWDLDDDAAACPQCRGVG